MQWSHAQPIPDNDRDIDRVLEKIPAIEQLAASCLSQQCVLLDCRAAQDIQLRVRDARWYMRHLYYWLKRAGESQRQHLESIASEAIMGAERAAYVQKILAWQQWFLGISYGLLEASSAGSNFKEIVENPKLLEKKTKREMLELFDNFYEGMKDVESLAERLSESVDDKDFPKFYAELVPTFGLIDKEAMNDIKSHLTDFYSLMKAANEHSGDFKKILKEGKGLAAIGQITGRFLKMYAEAEVKERQRLIDTLMRDVLATHPVQAESFRSLQRIQLRRNKAEDAYLALSRLVMADSKGSGGLTHCLLKLQSRCSSFDLSYTSKLKFPKDVSVENFSFVTEKDRNKSWGNALKYFNDRLGKVVALLEEVPAVSATAGKASLRTTSGLFHPGEFMSVHFTALPCFARDSWVGIVRADQPHGDDLATGSYVLGERKPINGSDSGTLQFMAPISNGHYELRMFDKGTGSEVAVLPFTVGRKKHPMDGLYKEAGKEYYWKLTVSEDGFYIDISAWTPQNRNQETWVTVMIMNEKTAMGKNTIICGCGPDGRRSGEEKEVPFRMVFNDSKFSFDVQYYKVECKDCRLKVIPEWDESPLKGQHFFRVNEDEL